MEQLVFDDVKILEITSGVVGPLGTRYLADNGATVVRIESLTRPDILRLSMPYKENKPGIDQAGYFAYINANKYGMALNMRHPKAAEAKNNLIAWADAVVESYTPGVMERWGLGYDDLRKIKPEIIMVRASAQGQSGPHSDFPMYGFQLSSFCGFSHLSGWVDREPLALGVAYTDILCPRFVAIALMTALSYKRWTGKGQMIDISEVESSLQFLIPPILDYVLNSRIATRQGNACDYAAPHGVYRCKGNDRWCAIAVFNDQEWEKFYQVLGKPSWAESFSTLLARKQYEEELNRFIEDWTIHKTAEEVAAVMQAAGIAAAVVKNPAEIFNDPQLKERNAFWSLNHRQIGRVSSLGQSFKLSGTPPRNPMPAPCLGEHTEYVCKELLGMTEEEFDKLLIESVFE
jgi:crotonobetainyl-CoA:carnitine CoA-transferase CaiB-like acyl-CoA transferase